MNPHFTLPLLVISLLMGSLIACSNPSKKIPVEQIEDIRLAVGMPLEKAVAATMAPTSDAPKLVPDHFKATEERKRKVAERKEAVQFFEGLFLRDPYILNAPDGYYYYTGTRLNQIKGGDSVDWSTEGIELWKSKDLLNWELVGVPFRFADLSWINILKQRGMEMKRKPMMWAPEIHNINGQWVFTHTTSVRRANLILADSPSGPIREVYPNASFGHRHDPTLFKDDDGKVYLLSSHNKVQELKPTLDGFVGEQFKIAPANRKMGHEGLTMMKIGKKYIIFGTGWSQDKLRHGTYNMYYATADNLRGPYSDRRFLGRFLGHGTPFVDKNGNWWTTAFKNGDYISFEDLAKLKDQGGKAHTTMKSGFRLIPIEPKIDASGDVFFNVLDERYRYPGPEENQRFEIRRW